MQLCRGHVKSRMGYVLTTKSTDEGSLSDRSHHLPLGKERRNIIHVKGVVRAVLEPTTGRIVQNGEMDNLVIAELADVVTVSVKSSSGEVGIGVVVETLVPVCKLEGFEVTCEIDTAPSVSARVVSMEKRCGVYSHLKVKPCEIVALPLAGLQDRAGRSQRRECCENGGVQHGK